MDIKNSNNLVQGNLPKTIFKIALPTMGGRLFQALYDIIDLIFIGLIAPDAVASITVFMSFFWTIGLFNEIIETSSVSMLGQNLGAKKNEKTVLIAEQSIAFNFFLSFVTGLLLIIFMKPLFGFFSSDPDVISFGMDYGIIRCWFLPFFFSSYSVNTIFRTSGNAKLPMILLTISSILNIILDPIFMFDTIPWINLPGLGLRMKGAAIATTISVLVSFLIGIIILLSKKSPIRIRIKGLFRLNWAIDKQLITIGLPIGLEVGLWNVFLIIFLKIASTFGSIALTIIGICMKLYNFFVMPQIGMHMAGGIIIGHSIGANNKKRALETVKLLTLLCIALSLIPIALLIIFPKSLLALFIHDYSIIYSGVAFLRLIAYSVFITSITVGFDAAFVGSGMNKPLFYTSFISQFVIMVPYILIIHFFDLPMFALWFTFILGDTAHFLMLRYFYKKKKWLNFNVIS